MIKRSFYSTVQLAQTKADWPYPAPSGIHYLHIGFHWAAERRYGGTLQYCEPLARAGSYIQSAIRCINDVGVNASFTFDASVKQFIQLLSGRSIFLISQETLTG